MRERQITEEEARKAAVILKEECGWRADDRDVHSFVYHVTRDCREYRFQGALGFGGKFRNNGNHEGVPYVDCYPENETPDRNEMIEKANRKLAELFV